MFGNLQIEALAHNCAQCDKPLTDKHLIQPAYIRKSIRDFSIQMELGIIGANVRTLWIHFDCQKPLFTSWIMRPDMHSCIRCKNKLTDRDMVQPVFQIVDSKAVNPNDSTDVGIALNDRIYFVHCDCTNTRLDSHSSNIILGI